MVQRIDDETQETLISQGLAGDIDGATALARQFDFPGTDRSQRRVDHPAVDLRHQLIALGGAQEIGTIGKPAMFIGHTNQYLDRGPGSLPGAGGDDRLHGQFELAFMQGFLQLP